MRWLLLGVAVLAGLSNPIQSAANAQLGKSLGHVLPAALAIYGVALAGLLLCIPVLGLPLRDVAARAAGAPWWAWAGGLCNLAFVLSAAVATQRIGSAVFTVTVACSAIVLSIGLDRLGIMGLHERPLSALRLVGGAMAIGGILLVAKG